MADLDVTDRNAGAFWDQPFVLLCIVAAVLPALGFADIVPLRGGLAGFIAAASLAFWRYQKLGATTESLHYVDKPTERESSPSNILSEIALAALEQLPDPVLILDSSGRVVFANGSADTIIGADAEDKQISALIRNPSLLEAIASVSEREDQQIIDYSIPVPVERHIRASIARIHVHADDRQETKDKAKPSILLVLHDFTSVKRSEQMWADFVANASHELRTPLASLSGFIETLRGHAREDAAAREKFLEIMQVQANRMGRLIDDLLSLSRIEMNEHVPPSAAVDLVGVVCDVLDALGPRARAEEVTLRAMFEGAPFKPQTHHAAAWVLGDRDELIQVIQNLVDNAIKYGKRGGAVTIDLGVTGSEDSSENSENQSVSNAETSYYLAVHDQGDGIDPQHLPRLTERFYRVDVQRSRERGGTGLGLAIVKHIINRHRGVLKIESELAKGSTFTAHLPAAKR